MIRTTLQIVCQHPIYCQGDILHTVQKLHIFPDSKTFVDMPLKDSVDSALTAWSKLPNKNKDTVSAFLEEHFLKAGSDQENVVPSDFNASPNYVNKILDPKLKTWALEINEIWKLLCKQFTIPPEKSSFIPTPKPFIVPGGRFREFYYWDTFWVVEGLLISDMVESALNMHTNFRSFIENYGYVPNGARIYYQGRSQPMVYPLITDKIYEKLLSMGKVAQAKQLASEAFPSMEKEFEFFYMNRGIRACKVFKDAKCDVMLYHYDCDARMPRPESYREDLELAKDKVGAEKENLYRQLGAAAESGWDFSSRWFEKEDDQKSIRTTDLIPFDLNVIMVLNLKVLQKFSKVNNQPEKELYYELLVKNSIETLLKYFSHGDHWDDYLLTEGMLLDRYYPSNYFMMLLKNDVDPKYIESLELTLDKYEGGVPTSLVNSGQQWDLPNSWPPINHLLVKGLLNNNRRDLALKLAQKVIRNAYLSYQNAKTIYGEGMMFEKYNAEEVGKQGGGGEYEVQAGFGWTNGVMIWMLNEFGAELGV